MAQIPIALEVRCLRIPANWALRKDTLGDEWNLVPTGIKENVTETIEEPWELRKQFLRMKHDEKTAVDFLNEVGIWQAIETPTVPAWARSAGLELSGAFGHRTFFGWAQPTTFERLWKLQEHWKNLDLKNLRKQFGPPPANTAAEYEKIDFALKAAFQNTLPIHMEWRQRRKASGQQQDLPSAVIQPITGWELLTTTMHVDLITHAQFYICQRPDCGIWFTGRKRKFCSWYCGHIESVRKDRREKGGNRAKKR